MSFIRRNRTPLGRRAMLRGAGGIAIALPFLDAMLNPKRSSAAPDAAPKRLLVFFSANGSAQDIWAPSGGETSFNIADHPVHAPLQPHRDDIIIIDGVDNEVSYHSGGDGHQTGMGCMITAAPLLAGDDFCLGSCEDPTDTIGWGGGISVDQYVADQVEKETTTKFRSLEMGVQVNSSTVWSRMSYRGPDQPLPHREDPSQNLVDLFSDLDADPLELALLRKKRKSVLDVVGDDYARLSPRLGKDDKIKVDQHLESIRAIEKRLDANGFVGAACETPDPDIPGDINNNDNYPAVGRAQMDLLVMALACDLTRVGSLQWSTSVSNKRFSWLENPIPEGHHDLSHFDDSDGYALDAITRINHWYTEQFAYLLAAMKAIPEGEGTLLDNSVVLWVNELGKGNSHTRRDLPFVLAGNCQGYFNTGRYMSYGGADEQAYHGRLLVSMCHAMGYPVSSFGMPEYSEQGPLPGLTG
jgi:hypothetical protein